MKKKDKKEKKSVKATANEPKRQQRIVCLLNEEELKVVNRYLKRYKITNKSHWVRETILASILKNLEEDYPTLFNEHEMRR